MWEVLTMKYNVFIEFAHGIVKNFNHIDEQEKENIVDWFEGRGEAIQVFYTKNDRSNHWLNRDYVCSMTVLEVVGYEH